MLHVIPAVHSEALLARIGLRRFRTENALDGASSDVGGGVAVNHADGFAVVHYWMIVRDDVQIVHRRSPLGLPEGETIWHADGELDRRQLVVEGETPSVGQLPPPESLDSDLKDCCLNGFCRHLVDGDDDRDVERPEFFHDGVAIERCDGLGDEVEVHDAGGVQGGEPRVVIFRNHQAAHRRRVTVLHELLHVRGREAKHLQMLLIGAVAAEHDLVDLIPEVEIDLGHNIGVALDEPETFA